MNKLDEFIFELEQIQSNSEMLQINKKEIIKMKGKNHYDDLQKEICKQFENIFNNYKINDNNETNSSNEGSL